MSSPSSAGVVCVAGHHRQMLDQVLETEQPDYLLLHGDTNTASAYVLAAFHRRIRIGHVEAGLRTGNLAMPFFPEEMNRPVVNAIGN